jgi:hypothetical protein
MSGVNRITVVRISPWPSDGDSLRGEGVVLRSWSRRYRQSLKAHVLSLEHANFRFKAGTQRYEPLAFAVFCAHNDRMVIRGRVQNGVVVLENDTSLPEGMEVTVVASAAIEAASDTMSEEQRKRYLEALRRIDALPNENPNDAFSGADHDRVLYGDGEP